MKSKSHQPGRPPSISPVHEKRQRISVVLDRKTYRDYGKLVRQQHRSMSEDLRTEVRRKLAAQ